MKKVHFVGAGPGAEDLITLRGKSLLEESDLVIYAGSLVNPQLLKYTKENCQVFNSAKMTLDEVIDVMEKGFKEDKKIVRLHTGDPSIYGAIREQMDRLIELDIPYEVCPGVSSFCAAAASLKAEYTLPGVSQTVILTRAAGRTPVPEGEDIVSLAKHQATMILFLSASLIKKVVAELIEGGYQEDTPCAIIYKASWEDEKIIRCKISDLEEQAKAHDIGKTALICVGNFLGDDYQLSKLYDANFTTGYRKAKE